MTILDVKNLTTRFYTDEGTVHAVEDISFSLAGGQTLCVVGESGCGKSVMSLSLMRLIDDPPGRITNGSIMFANKGKTIDVMKLKNKSLREIRGSGMAMIFQEPMTSLNPVYTIGEQIAEAIKIHQGGNKSEIKEKVIKSLTLVGMPSPAARMKNYPHELSGGMRQRAMIAMAISCKPAILIADEPTTALDVTVQAQILDLMKDLQSRLGMSLIFVTHDLGVVAQMADKVAVMYAGRFVEVGDVDEIFNCPKHPYTKALLNSIPSLTDSVENKRLPTIPGRVPSLIGDYTGCTFANRCPIAKEKCKAEDVGEDPCGVGRLVRCFYANESI